MRGYSIIALATLAAFLPVATALAAAENITATAPAAAQTAGPAADPVATPSEEPAAAEEQTETVKHLVPGPKMVLSEVLFDFGTVEPQTIASHKFVVTNVGSEELLIKQVAPG